MSIRSALADDDEAALLSLVEQDTELRNAALSFAAHDDKAWAVRLMLSQGTDPDAITNSRKCTPLNYACYSGSADSVQLLLDANADMSKADVQGRTPLLTAFAKNHPECARLLVAARADVETADSTGATPLAFACDLNLFECTRLLLEANACPDGAKDCAPLVLAAKHVRLDCMQLLLKARADTENVGPIGPLGLPIVPMVREDGVTLSTPHELCTPLVMAVLADRLECVKLLLEEGANVDGNPGGFSALHEACKLGRWQCVQQLSSYGASRNLRSVYHRLQGGLNDAEQLASTTNLRDWLVRTRRWTPLHHLDQLTPKRTNALLRGGADPRAGEMRGGGMGMCTPGPIESPLQRAEGLLAEGRYKPDSPHGSPPALVVLHVHGWTPERRRLMPSEARARAMALARLGVKSILPSEPWNLIVIPRMLRAEFGAGVRFSYRKGDFW